MPYLHLIQYEDTFRKQYKYANMKQQKYQYHSFRKFVHLLLVAGRQQTRTMKCKLFSKGMHQ